PAPRRRHLLALHRGPDPLSPVPRPAVTRLRSRQPRRHARLLGSLTRPARAPRLHHLPRPARARLPGHDPRARSGRHPPRPGSTLMPAPPSFEPPPPPPPASDKRRSLLKLAGITLGAAAFAKAVSPIFSFARERSLDEFLQNHYHELGPDD